jgi:hypothetical protein
MVLLIAATLSFAAVQASSAQQENRMHTETTFDVLVHAPYAQTAALFSPEGERAWAGKHWDPQYLHNPAPNPAPNSAPASTPIPDKQGAVFTIAHRGGFKAVWVTTRRDLDARHFQYVYFIPEIMVTTIDVRFQVVEPHTTKVTVTYARTAVTPEGDEHVKAMAEGDQSSGKEWQSAIDEYLKTATLH